MAGDALVEEDAFQVQSEKLLAFCEVSAFSLKGGDER